MTAAAQIPRWSRGARVALVVGGAIVAGAATWWATRHNWPERLSGRQVAELLYRAGWRGADLEDAIRIVLGESAGVVRARNRNVRNGRVVSTDRGIWQWNDAAWPQISDADADDPERATAYAYHVWQRIGWQPWRGRTQLHTLKRDGRPDVALVARARALARAVEGQT